MTALTLHRYTLVEKPDQLEQLVQALQSMPVSLLAIDTEFVRTRTYYAQLGLVQIYDGEQCHLVDAVQLELSEFWSALRRHHWVLHAFGEDLEIIYRHAGGIGASVFDTQVACAFLGHGVSLGFQKFIQQELELEIDKGEARTDWLARPLSLRQLNYAAADVIHLLPAYQSVVQQLEQRALLSQVKEECARLAEVRKRTVEPELAYLDVKNAWRLYPQQLAVLKELAAWRLDQAMRRDLAINNVVKADSLWELAHKQPTSFNQLQALGLPVQETQRHGKKLLALIAKAKQCPASEFPPKVKRMVDYPTYKQKFKELRELVQKVAKDSGIPEDVLATKKVIHDYMQWLWDEPQNKAAREPLLLSGWRKPLFKLLADQEG